jgi:hypothetical protein
MKPLYNLIKYYYALLRHPALYDFIDMGLGIEARYQRNKIAWASHLDATKKFVEKALPQQPHSLLILGAGRLLDVPIEAIHRNATILHCIDADPLARSEALPLLKKPGIDVRYSCSEITGCMQLWSSILEAFLARSPVPTQSEIGSLLHKLVVPEASSWGSYDVVLSLNLLGQIPVYWRERFGASLLRYTHHRPDGYGRYPQELEDALAYSCRLLQEAHVKQVITSSKKSFILIYDERYIYTRDGREIYREDALYTPVAELLREHRIAASQRWLWDIAPQGVEQLEYGVAHEVVGHVVSKYE